MKKYLGFGVIFILILAISSIATLSLIRMGEKLDTSSREYVRESVIAITQAWDAEILWQRASPDLKAASPQEKIAEFFGLVRRRLGPLQVCSDVEGQADMGWSTEKGKQVTAAYSVDAEYEHGKAKIDIRLIQINGQWLIQYFFVRSPLLAKDPISE